MSQSEGYDIGLGADAVVRRMTLQQLSRAISDAVNSEPALQSVWVVAELSDVRVKQHCYMELIDKDERGAIQAKLRANIWASRYFYLREKFEKTTGTQLVSGIKVCLCGSVTYHPAYGMSFNVTDIDPSYTLGDMERQRKEILEKLAKEGVIDCNKELELEPGAQRIAIISAPGAAGYGDFIHQLDNNEAGYVFYHHLFAATMQGAGTSQSIREALAQIEQTIDLWDCVVIIRGGGATSDLNSFDDLELARAVATFRLPVIVGIGHERDRTVLDEIAHTRCKTPTAVATYLIEQVGWAAGEIARLTREISALAMERMTGDKRQIAMYEAQIPALVSLRLNSAKERLIHIGQLIPVAATSHITESSSQLQRFGDRMRDSLRLQLTMQKSRLKGLENLVNALSPEATLKRGYTITLLNGKAVTKADDVTPGETITTRTARGEFKSVIK